ncbi:MAG: glycosyltransferase family 4 protein [Verrucomicrobiota bacterium]
MKVAIITTHPIQYYAPWFRNITQTSDIDLNVLYLWNFGVTQQKDPGFKTTFQWDVPLLEGYPYHFIENQSSDPGTHHFWGINNPGLESFLLNWKADALLMIGYSFYSMQRLMVSPALRKIPFLLRGDSHRLVAAGGIKRYVKDCITRLLFQRFSAFLFCGEANRNYFLNHGACESELFFCPHSIDSNQFNEQSSYEATKSLKRQWKVPESDIVLLFVGKFEEKKQPLELIEAFNQISTDRTSLVFIGSGSLKNEMLKKSGNNPKIRICEFSNQSEMPDIYRAADLVILPSLGSYETWGLVIQESLFCGTPVLVSDHVGCYQDLVASKEQGWVFQAGNLQSLKETLNRALSELNSEGSRKVIQVDSIRTKYSYEQATHGLKTALESISR